MSITSFPFTSRDGDRKVKASEFRRYWKAISTNGITPGYLNECRCSKNGMNVVISTGAVIIQGTQAEIVSNETVAITAASTARYATVVLEFNDNEDYRDIHASVVYGTSTAPGTLMQTDAVWQIPLCTILVPANATTLASANIVDERAIAQIRLSSVTVTNPIARINHTKYAAPNRLWGDVNSDGKVDEADSTAIGTYIIFGGNIDNVAADLDGDGTVSVADAVLLSRLLQNKDEDQVIARTEVIYENGVKKVYWGYTDAN